MAQLKNTIIDGILDMNSHQINNIAAGVNDNDAVIKKQLTDVENSLSTGISNVQSSLDAKIKANTTLIGSTKTELDKKIKANTTLIGSTKTELDEKIKANTTLIGSTKTELDEKIDKTRSYSNHIYGYSADNDIKDFSDKIPINIISEKYPHNATIDQSIYISNPNELRAQGGIYNNDINKNINYFSEEYEVLAAPGAGNSQIKIYTTDFQVLNNFNINSLYCRYDGTDNNTILGFIKIIQLHEDTGSIKSNITVIMKIFNSKKHNIIFNKSTIANDKETNISVFFKNASYREIIPSQSISTTAFPNRVIYSPKIACGNFPKYTHFAENSDKLTISSSQYFTVGNGYIMSNGNAQYDNILYTIENNVYVPHGIKQSSADYAEYYEWEDHNKNNADRVGLFVQLNGEYINLQKQSDEYVLGIVSASPSIVGDAQSENWKNKYLTDAFNRKILQKQDTIVAEYDDDGNVVKKIIQKNLPTINPEYNPDQEYIPREARPEWAPIGTHGKLVVIDDGTCEVNGYAWPSHDGIATKDTVHKQYRVMSRLDETHVRVVLK